MDEGQLFGILGMACGQTMEKYLSGCVGAEKEVMMTLEMCE